MDKDAEAILKEILGENALKSKLAKLLGEKEYTLYDDLMVENANMFYALRTGDIEAFKNMLHKREEEGMADIEAYAEALEQMHIISTRFYVQGIDITLAMREKIYKDECFDSDIISDSGTLIKSIRTYENICFANYMKSRKSAYSEEDAEKYRAYLNLARQLNSYDGESSTSTCNDNFLGFRRLVEQLIDARKKCTIYASFTGANLTKAKRKLLNKETITYEQELEIAEELIENYVEARFGLYTPSDEELYKDLCSDPTPMRKRIEEKFVTNYLEQCGLDRHMYKNYVNGTTRLPTKKFLIALGIFCEPYSVLDKNTPKEYAFRENLEKFMNQNGQSIKSCFDTITEFDNMTDADLCYLLDSGISMEMLAYMLKNFAKAGKDIKAKTT